MTPERLASLRDRALAEAPGGPSRFGVLLLLILGAILSTVIAHYVELLLSKCDAATIRNPGFLERWKLRRAVRAMWGDPRFAAAVESLRDEPGFDYTEYAALHDTLDRRLGNEACVALLGLAAGLTDDDLKDAGVTG